MARGFVVRHVFTTPADELAGLWGAIGAGHDERRTDLAQTFVGDTDDGGHADERMPDQIGERGVAISNRILIGEVSSRASDQLRNRGVIGIERGNAAGPHTADTTAQG